jgi:HEAT repeat protein
MFMAGRFKSKLKRIVAGMRPEDRASTCEDIESVLNAGVASFGDLLELLQDEHQDTELRTTASWLAVRFDSGKAESALLAVLKDKVPDVRASAARELSMAGSPQTVQPLIDTMLDDEDKWVRFASAYALGSIGDRRAVTPLLSLLANGTEDAEVRGMAAEALGKIGDPSAVQPLITALDDPSVEVRFWAVFALGLLGDPRAIPKLEKIVLSDEAVYPRIGSIKDEAIEAISMIKSFGVG